jgi:hypothetical protein
VTPALFSRHAPNSRAFRIALRFRPEDVDAFLEQRVVAATVE